MTTIEQSLATGEKEKETFLGRVKWFNNRSGYGFITITDGSKSGTDVFAHHSGIVVLNQQYKYLVQGEYVQFNLEKTTTGLHEFQAVGINGIKGGQLMCETRNELLQSRASFRNNSSTYVKPNPTSVNPTSREQRQGREGGSGRGVGQGRGQEGRGQYRREAPSSEWKMSNNKTRTQEKQETDGPKSRRVPLI